MSRAVLDPPHRHDPPHGRRGRPPGGREPLLTPRRIVLAAVVLALLATVRSLAPSSIRLGDAVQDMLTLAISVVIESLPFVFLGLIISVAVQLFVPQRLITRVLPRTPVLRRAVLSLLGILLPVCECGNVPLARGLVMRGFSTSDAMTFLLAAPLINPVTIITTYHAFGWADGILVWRILGGFLIANLVGWLLSRHPRPEQLLTPRFQEACRVHQGEAQRGGRMRRAVRLFSAETTAMLPALFVGAGIAGVIQVAVSRDLLLALGQNPVLSVLALMALAFVISICSNVDAFFILSLGSAFTPGSIVAFLLFGAMIDIKMLALMRTTFTARTLVVVTVVVALATAVIGLGVNLAR